MLTNNSLVNSTCRGQYFGEEQRESVKGTEQELERARNRRRNNSEQQHEAERARNRRWRQNSREQQCEGKCARNRQRRHTCSEQHWKKNGPGKGGKTAANSHARPKERGIEKGGEIAANNAKRNGSVIDRIDKQDAKENSKGKESSSQSETVPFQQKVTTGCLFLLSYR